MHLTRRIWLFSWSFQAGTCCSIVNFLCSVLSTIAFLTFSFRPLDCPSFFNLRLPIIPLVSSNFPEICYDTLTDDKHSFLRYHCRQRAPVGIDLSSSGTSQLGMFDIQTTTKSKYYDHIVLLHLESRRCRYRSIIFACFYLYITANW